MAYQLNPNGRTMLRLFFAGLLVLAAGCATTAPMTQMTTVEGQVTVVGSEPFTQVLLVTDDRHAYILTGEGTPMTTVANNTPGRFEVTGEVYVDQWNGSRHAHLRVVEASRK